MWIKGNYRRNLMDMHIDDWNPEFLSKINVKEYVEALKDAGVQAAMVKGKPHTGLCYYPTKVGRMHRCEFPYKSRVMPTSEPLKTLKAPYMARNTMKWGFFRLKSQ